MGERLGAAASTPDADRLYAHLREAIMTGALAPGSAPFGEVAGVSVDPEEPSVRDAFSRLNYDGLVNFAPQRGAVVTLISVADVREALFIRGALETAAAAEAARRMPEAGKFELRQNLRRLRSAMKSGCAMAIYAADLAFHDILVRSLRLNLTGEILRGLHGHVDRVRRIMINNESVSGDVLADHQAIVDSIDVGDDNTARRQMAAHLQRTADRFETLVRERPRQFDFRRANGAPE